MMRGLLIAAALTGLTASDSKDLDQALAGRVAGAPKSCLSTTGLGAPQIIGNHILLYQGGRHLWRNDLPAACPGLDSDAIIVNEVNTGELCRDDQFYTLQRSGGRIPGPRCRLGDFVPWDKPKR